MKNKILRRVFILIKHGIFRVKSKVMRDDDEWMCRLLSVWREILCDVIFLT